MTHRLLTNYKVVPYDIFPTLCQIFGQIEQVDFSIGLVRCPSTVFCFRSLTAKSVNYLFMIVNCNCENCSMLLAPNSIDAVTDDYILRIYKHNKEALSGFHHFAF